VLSRILSHHVSIAERHTSRAAVEVMTGPVSLAQTARTWKSIPLQKARRAIVIAIEIQHPNHADSAKRPQVPSHRMAQALDQPHNRPPKSAQIRPNRA
jgi:hypothetical protein